MPYRDSRREKRHDRRGDTSKEKREERGKAEEGKRERDTRKDGDKPRATRKDGDKPRATRKDGDKPRATRKDGDKPRAVKHSKHRSRSRENDSEQEESRSERTDRFKSERFADDNNLTTSQKHDRGFRTDKIGRSAVVRERRRSSGYHERRYRHEEDDDYETNRVTEKLSNPTYVPKGTSYFLHDDREMQSARHRGGQRPRSPVKWEHDLFKDHEQPQEPEVDTVIADEEDDDNTKWRSVVKVPVGSTGFGPQYDSFYHQHQRQQDGRWMHDKYFEMEGSTATAATR
ncbi:RNA-binding protein 25-like [Dysidea avara]|uniref:RNA-binding protein 25-like n=1 Tax=Dysidea avara TaxID=196820 RepID=UPI0033343BE6